MRLELGGGHAPAPGHVNIDIVPEADIVWDLNKGLPKRQIANWPNKFDVTDEKSLGNGAYLVSGIDEKFFIEGIRCHQVLEHLHSIIALLNDCYSIMKEGAVMEVSTPLAGTSHYWQDPTHVKGFVPESFLYFQKDSPYTKEQKEYGITARFKVETEILDGWNLNVKLTK